MSLQINILGRQQWIGTHFGFQRVEFKVQVTFPCLNCSKMAFLALIIKNLAE
jgi:hypothetical protein